MKSKQIKVNSLNDLPLDSGFCRRCGKIKNKAKFYSSPDKELDVATGLLSLCKECCNELFNLYLKTESSTEQALLRFCRSLNWKYDDGALQATLSQLEDYKSNGKILPPLLGIYKLKLVSKLNMPMNQKTNVDLTYQPVESITINNSNILSDIQNIIDEDLAKFWGEKYTQEELEFLEYELSDWKRSYSCSNKGEELILKELCYKSLELRKARIENRSTDTILKSTQDLMKSGALTPAQTNAVSAGKNPDTFGVWIKEIENIRPAEWVENHSLFKDVDNIQEYAERFITSPLRALVTGSREFSIEADETVDAEIEGE